MVTGNTVIDALLWTVQQSVPYGDPALEAIDSADAPVLLVTTHRRESWGQRMRDVASAVAGLARKHPDLIVVLPLHPNPVVREALLPSLHGLDNVILVEPQRTVEAIEHMFDLDSRPVPFSDRTTTGG